MVHRRAALVLVLLAAFLMVPAFAAWAEGEAVRGTVSVGNEALEGVEIVARTAEGEEVGSATTDAEGAWEIVLDQSGRFVIELQTDTLPEGVELTDPDRNPIELEIFGGLSRRVVFNFDEGVAVDTFWERVPQFVFSGLKTGLIIAIASVGLSLLFGTTGLINFAHGEFVSLGAIIAWFLNREGPQLPFVGAALLAVALAGVFGGVMDAGFFSRLRKRRISGFQFLVITIGLSLLLQSVLRLWYGNSFGNYTIPRQTPLRFGGIVTTPRDLVVMGLSLAVLLGVGILLQTTRTGKAMRAVSDNKDLAESSGIDVNRIILSVWVSSGALAAVGGIFFGAVVNVHYLNGFKLLLLMFAAVILGGLGSAYGAMVGGLAIGFATEITALWLPSELKVLSALVILILVLLVRPQGLLGVRERLG